METPSCPPAILTAVRRILRPLVRLLLSYGVGYTALIDLLKAVYVDVADQDFRIDGKAQTISRISLLTGVHRKDVKRLLEEKGESSAPPPQVSLGGKLVAVWSGGAPYVDELGAPRPLPRLASQGDASFESLVASISKDIRPRAVLDEWVRLGVARIDEQDRVCLNVNAFVPQQGLAEKAYYFEQHIHDHLAAIAHNLSGVGSPLLERSVYYGALSPESVRELAQLAEKHGMQTLQILNRRAMELQSADRGKAAAQQRMRLGVYFFHAPDEKPDADE